MVSWRNTAPRKRSAVAPASFIDPARPVRAAKPPSGLDWLHEIKHDGYRLQIHKRGKSVALYTMTGRDWTNRYPWIVEGAWSLKPDHVVLDAEAVFADGDGLTLFDELHSRAKDAYVFAYAFDLLAIEGEDVRALPIEQRKARLEKLLPRPSAKTYAQSGILLSEHLHGDGDLVFDQACLLGLEGIVSKKLGSK